MELITLALMVIGALVYRHFFESDSENKGSAAKPSRDNSPPPLPSNESQFSATRNQAGPTTNMNPISDDPLVRIERTLYLAFASAWSDGELDPAETSVIGEWVASKFSEFPPYQREQVRQRINTAMIKAHESARRGESTVLNQASLLGRDPSPDAKFEALALCARIMHADGAIKESEIIVIERLGEHLGLARAVIASIVGKLPERDRTSSTDNDSGDEKALGLSMHIGRPTMCTAIRQLFDDISSQLQIEADRDKREHYKSQLAKLTKLRQKHGCS